MPAKDDAFAAVALAGTLVVASACATLGSAPAYFGSLDVEVTVEGRDDASGVEVTAGEQTAETGSDGVVSFEELPAFEPLTVTATLGEATTEDTVTLDEGQRASMSLVLSAQNTDLAITELLLAGPEQIPVEQSADVSVAVEYEGSEPLSYDWSISSDWAIESDASSASITAPAEAGVLGEVSVTVSTDAGASATASRELESVDCDEEPLPCVLYGSSVRHRVTIDTSELDETLIDVPLVLPLDSADIDHEAAAENGADVRLAEPPLTGTLDHEIDTWTAEDTSYVWVRIPELAPGGDEHELWLYYGNPDVGDGQDPGGVWSSGYGAVWHAAALDEDTGLLSDSTEHDNIAESPLADWSGRLGPGFIGEAFETDGHDGVDVGAEPPPTFFAASPTESLDFDDAFTLEAVVDIDDDWRDLGSDGDGVDWAIVLSGPDGSDERAYLGIGRRGGGVINCRVHPAAADEPTRNDQPEDAIPDAAQLVIGDGFLYLACSYDGENLRAYIDGELVHDVPIDPGGPLVGQAADEDFFIGRRHNDRRFGGLIDGVRVSTAARSDAWIRVQQAAMAGDITDVGPAEALE